MKHKVDLVKEIFAIVLVVVVVVVDLLMLPCSFFCSLHGFPQPCLFWVPWLESGDLFGPLESKSFSKEKGNKNEPKIITI